MMRVMRDTEAAPAARQSRSLTCSLGSLCVALPLAAAAAAVARVQMVTNLQGKQGPQGYS